MHRLVDSFWDAGQPLERSDVRRNVFGWNVVVVWIDGHKTPSIIVWINSNETSNVIIWIDGNETSNFIVRIDSHKTSDVVTQIDGNAFWSRRAHKVGLAKLERNCNSKPLWFQMIENQWKTIAIINLSFKDIILTNI